MPYGPEDVDQLDKQIIKLYRDATICRDVKALMESPGWKNTVGPLLDKMIIDVVGGKINDTWTSGLLDRAKKEERREFYIGYKQALIDLHGRMMFHLTQLVQLEDQIKQREGEKQPKYHVPMVDDTRYGEPRKEGPGY